MVRPIRYQISQSGDGYELHSVVTTEWFGQSAGPAINFIRSGTLAECVGTAYKLATSQDTIKLPEGE